MKRIVSFVLATILCLGFATVAYAAGDISGIKESLDYNNQSYLENTEYKPGDVLEFPLTANMFEWSDGSVGGAGIPVTKAQLSKAKVDIKYSGSDTSMIKSISIEESKNYSLTGKQKTAYVRVVFKDTSTAVDPVNFRISLYLTYKNSRNETSKAVIEGSFQAPTISVSANKDYVDISKGQVLVPTEFIRSIDVDIGAGVIIKARLYADNRYYGKAEERRGSADDAVLAKFDSIEYILFLSTKNLKASGNIVDLSAYNNMYVYDGTGKYLGTADSLLPYSDKYFLSYKQINMTGSVPSGSSSSSSSSSISSSSIKPSSSSSTSASSAVTNNGAITKDVASKQAQSAVSTAKASGSKTATVRFKNYTSISADALKAMSNAGSGITVNLVADTMNANTVTGRLTINSSAAAKLTNDTKLGVRVDSASVDSTKNLFSRWYSNKLAVVSMDQKGSFGMTVNVAAKVSLSGMNTKNLYFYSYNKSTNEFFSIKNPNYSVDANGYLYFSTTTGGDIIVSNGPLAK